MADFLVNAWLAGTVLALAAGPLGAFVVWRRLAYFGDTLSHSALLGVTLGFLLQITPIVAVMLSCLGVALLLALLQQRRNLATDALLGVMAHSTLALGLLALSFMHDIRVDLLGYLFGDLLAVSLHDLYWIFAVSTLALIVLIVYWNPLLSLTLHEELAQVDGLPVGTLRMVLMLLIAAVIAVAMKVVGVLLITALLIIPAAAAQRHARSPEQIAIGAAGLGVIAISAGLALSWYQDTPAGPSVVIAATGLFILSWLIPRS